MDGLVLLRRARDAGLRVEAAGDKLLNPRPLLPAREKKNGDFDSSRGDNT